MLPHRHTTPLRVQSRSKMRPSGLKQFFHKATNESSQQNMTERVKVNTYREKNRNSKEGPMWLNRPGRRHISWQARERCKDYITDVYRAGALLSLDVHGLHEQRAQR